VRANPDVIKAYLGTRTDHMGFFLETLLGGLMAGMLYSLVALGFVLIFKASGVFNFAQGAMVLFGALAMARFAEWLPGWTGIDNKIVANAIAFVIAGAVMFVVAWAVERLVLRHLVNQEGATLLMATLGIAYFLEGLGQTPVRQQHLQDRHRHAQGPGDRLRVHLPGRHPDQQGRPDRGAHRRRPGGRAERVLPEDRHRPRAARRRRRPPGRAVHRHPAAAHLVHRVVRGRRRGAGGRDDLGQQAGRAVLAGHGGLRALPVVILGGLTSVPGAILGGLIIGVGEKLSEVYIGPLVGGGIEIWFAYVLALGFLLVRPQGLFGEKIIDRV
jgi:branched-chain amino acid transport system permease protein